MTGRLYIDNADAYSTYGVYVTENGWNELIAYPPMKAVDTYDWLEEDGVEADLSAPVLDSHSISLNVAISGDRSYYLALIEALSDGAYHTFNCAHIQRTYQLRLVSATSVDLAMTLCTATLKFADDFPLEDYEYLAPSSSLATDTAYTIDSVPTTDYGLRILSGTLNDIVKTADVKANLTTNVKTMPGVIYDDEVVKFKSKEVKLNCLMTAATLTELWRNYDALLYNLTQPNERVLGVGDMQESFRFYYKSCQVTNFYPDGKIWLQFALTVIFTTDLRIGSEVLLFSEDDELITTETGYAVNMQRNVNL